MKEWNQVEILMVEDNLSDAELTLRALRKVGATQKVLRLSDGSEALDFIFRKGRFSDRDELLPKLILLDLKMPRVGGIEFLEKLRQDDATANITVAVLTSSTEDRPYFDSQDLGVRDYLLKPVSSQGLISLMQRAELPLAEQPPAP